MNQGLFKVISRYLSVLEMKHSSYRNEPLPIISIACRSGNYSGTFSLLLEVSTRS